MDSYRVEWKNQQMIVPHWCSHGLPAPLFLAVFVSQLLGQEPLTHRRTLKSFNKNVPGGRRVGTL